jgi:hypothetical protein
MWEKQNSEKYIADTLNVTLQSYLKIPVLQ